MHKRSTQISEKHISECGGKIAFTQSSPALVLPSTRTRLLHLNSYIRMCSPDKVTCKIAVEVLDPGVAQACGNFILQALQLSYLWQG